MSSSFTSSSFITPTPFTSSPTIFHFIRHNKHTLFSLENGLFDLEKKTHHDPLIQKVCGGTIPQNKRVSTLQSPFQH